MNVPFTVSNYKSRWTKTKIITSGKQSLITHMCHFSIYIDFNFLPKSNKLIIVMDMDVSTNVLQVHMRCLHNLNIDDRSLLCVENKKQHHKRNNINLCVKANHYHIDFIFTSTESIFFNITLDYYNGRKHGFIVTTLLVRWYNHIFGCQPIKPSVSVKNFISF